MVTNADDRRPTTRELLATIEKFEREAEIEAEVERRLEEERAIERAERARQAELRMASVRRSQLTAMQKSQIIRTRGIEFYNSLDW